MGTFIAVIDGYPTSSYRIHEERTDHISLTLAAGFVDLQINRSTGTPYRESPPHLKLVYMMRFWTWSRCYGGIRLLGTLG